MQGGELWFRSMVVGLHHSPLGWRIQERHFSSALKSLFISLIHIMGHAWPILSPELSEMMSKVVSAAEELPLLLSWLTHLCARRDCSWKKSSRGHSDGSQTDSRGWGMLWICQHLAAAQPSLSSQMIQTLSKVGGSPTATWSVEKPVLLGNF